MTSTLSAPAGLKGLFVADTTIGAVRGSEGFFHYRQYDAVDVASQCSFESVAGLLLDGEAPSEEAERRVRLELGRARVVPDELASDVSALVTSKRDPLSAARALLAVALDSRPTLDLSPADRRVAVLAGIGLTPTIVAASYRTRLGLPPLAADPTLGHAADYLRMLTGSLPTPAQVRSVEHYLNLTADHGFNASTFAARVITSTGADVGGVLAGAFAALSGPLHGGAPSRVLDMLDAIGDPENTEEWASAELAANRKIMGFGHAVYRAEDPRAKLLCETARTIGGELVDRALAVESRMLAYLRDWKPNATIVTNVEYWAAIALHLAGVPQSMFTPTFATSRIVGWSAHILEQAASNRIMRPSARYVGPEPTRFACDGS